MKKKEIPLSENFSIKVMPRNFELRRRRIHDNPNRAEFGQEYSTGEGYAPSIESLLSLMIDRECTEGDIKRFTTLVAAKKRMITSLKRKVIGALEDALVEIEQKDKLILALQKELEKERSKNGEHCKS